jgi:hypothetical protein
MDNSWVVVVGTLGGVMVTSISGILGIILTARHQRAIAERQMRDEAKDKLRAERRETFVDYLSAYQDMYGRALAIADSRFKTGLEDRSSPPPLAQDFALEAPEEAARFSRAYHELVITGGSSTREAAHDCTSKLWDLAYAAAEADADSFARLKNQARPSRQHLREAMRAELGVE